MHGSPLFCLGYGYVHTLKHPRQSDGFFMEKEIEVPILNDEYKVIVCFGDDKVTKKVLKSWGHKIKTVKSELVDRRGVCFYSKDCHPVIVLPRFPKTSEEIGTLAHEAFHAVNNIFDKIQGFKDDETFAHSIGAVVRLVLKNKDKPPKK